MASAFTELCIDCADVDRLAGFWCSVLDWEVVERFEDGVQIGSSNGSRPRITFVKVPEGKVVKNRLHIDVNPVDRDQEEEVERVLALGASRADVGQGPDVSWVVMQDPEGNEFCILRTRVDA
ncbi:MAG: VOC family protein [Actinomycetota bacterium]|nr:VOC family protein [Actinomycetota bacterium]